MFLLVPPKFDNLTAAHFAIPGANHVLRWKIVESRPPVKHWTLYKDDMLVAKDTTPNNTALANKYHLEKIDGHRPMFILSVIF